MRNSRKIRFISVLTLLSFSSGVACSTAPKYYPHDQIPSQESAVIEAAPVDENAVAPGFVFRLNNLEDKSLNGNFRVAFDGKLVLPYNVTIATHGLSIAELQKKVAAAYRPYFKSGSRVRLDLVERAYWIDIRGLATKPGRYLVKQDTTLDEVVAKGGGFPKESPAKFVRISSAQGANMTIDLDRYYRTGDPAKLPPWMGGELVFFQSEEGRDEIGGTEPRNSVRMLGEVRRPGDVSFRSGADFLYYLNEAGGPTNSVNPEKIQIYRKGKNIEFSMDKAVGFPPLERGDTVVLFPNRPSPFERFIQSGVGIASIISAIALVVLSGRDRR
jgi:protein involved in polysaccharide export with SLBB domain